MEKNFFKRSLKVFSAFAAVFLLSFVFCTFPASAYDTDQDANVGFSASGQTELRSVNSQNIPAPEINNIVSTFDSITVKFKESGADGFIMSIADNSDFFGEKTIQGASTLSFSELVPNTTYYLKTYAFRNVGGNTYYSEPVIFTCKTKIIDRPVVDYSRSNSVESALRIEFNKVSGVSGYKMLISDNRNFTNAKSVKGGSSLRFDYLKPHTAYYLKAYTYKKIGNKYYYSDTLSFTYSTKALPKPKVNYNASNSVESALRIEFNKVSGVSGYKMLISDNRNFTNAKSVKGGSSLRFDYLKPHTAYYLKAYTYKKIGNKYYYSDTLSFTYSTKALPKPKVNYNASNSVESALRIEFNKVSGVSGYKMLISDNRNFTNAKSVKGGSSLRYDYLTPNTTYYLKAYTYKKIGDKYYYSDTLSFTYKTKQSLFSNLFYVKSNSAIYDKNYRNIGRIESGALYSGYYSLKYPSYAVLKFRYGEVLIKRSSVSVRSNAKILSTAAIGQFGDKIAGYSACGPAAASILINSEKNQSYNKDDLILFSEKNYLNDQGSLRGGGGMTAPKLLELIKGYSKGKYSARNIYDSNCASVLKKQIDSGHRAIVVVQYTSSIVTHYSSGTHYVVVCGYEYINGTLYFYYADPYYGNGGRSLLRVSASILQSSINMVVREPKAIIVLN